MNNPDYDKYQVIKPLEPDTNPLESDGEFQMTVMNPNPSFKARRDGDHYWIEWEYSKEEWEWFTDPNIDRTGMVLELTGVVTHRNQKKTPPETKQKGGKWSQQAGIMCGNPLYHSFLKEKYPKYWEYHYDEGPILVSAEDIAAAVTREILNIKSRKELDTNPEARKRFFDLMHHFNRWTEGKDGHN